MVDVTVEVQSPTTTQVDVSVTNTPVEVTVDIQPTFAIPVDIIVDGNVLSSTNW